MFIRSNAIAPDVEFDIKYAETGVGGQNVSPDFVWGDAPEGTKSFALTCYDPDAPTGSGWWHWIVTDIPAEVTSIPEGGPIPDGAREWTNDYGYVGWGGSFPPPGPAHHYEFTVHALPVERLDAPDGGAPTPVRFAIMTQHLATATVVGMFQNPSAPGAE